MFPPLLPDLDAGSFTSVDIDSQRESHFLLVSKITKSQHISCVGLFWGIFIAAGTWRTLITSGFVAFLGS